MGINIADSLRSGLNSTFKTSGLILTGAFFVTTLISSVGIESLFQEFGLETTAATGQSLLSMELPFWAAGSLTAVALVASSVLTVAAIRTLVKGNEESVPREHFTSNIGAATANLLGGGIALGLLLGGVSALSVAPGVAAFMTGSQLAGVLLGGLGFIAGMIAATYLSVSLYFWSFEVAMEDANFFEAFRSSWEMTGGNKFSLLALMLAVGLASSVAGWILSAPSMIGLNTAGSVLSVAGTAIGAVFGLATLADAYRQLR